MSVKAFCTFSPHSPILTIGRMRLNRCERNWTEIAYDPNQSADIRLKATLTIVDRAAAAGWISRRGTEDAVSLTRRSR